MAYSVVTDYTTTLASPMTGTQLTVPVNSIVTKDATPVTLTTADMGLGWYLTIDPGKSSEEIVLVTAITPGSGVAGTFTVPATGRGLAFSGSTDAQASGNAYAHNPGAIVILSNVKNVYDRLVDRESNESVGGVKTFTSVPKVPLVPTAPEDVPSKNYVDSVVVAVGGVTAGYVQQNGADPSLTINVGAGQFIFGSANITYAGGSAVAVTASQTNYVQLDNTGTLVVNITGFITGNLPLATVVTSGTDITSVTDKRPFFSQPDTVQVVSRDFTYGATLSAGDPVRVNAAASNKLIKALATTAANADGFLGVCLDAGVDTNTKKRVQVAGLVTGVSGITPDAAVYLTDAGAFSGTPGTYKKSVGYGVTSTSFILTRTVSIDQTSGTNAAATTANLNEAMTFFSTTDITGAEAETLSAGATSNADSLHTHNSLIAGFNLSFNANGSGVGGFVMTPGYSDATSDIIAVGVYENSSGDNAFFATYNVSTDSPTAVYPAAAVTTQALSASSSTPVHGIRIGSDYWTADPNGGADIRKNGSAVAISGTNRFGPLGHDATNAYLLILYSTTKIARFTGIATTTITNASSDITLDTAVTATCGFVFDDLNDQYVCVDTTNNLIRKFNSGGTTLGTTAYTIDDTNVVGVTLINGRYHLIVAIAPIGVSGSKFLTCMTVPTLMVRG